MKQKKVQLSFVLAIMGISVLSFQNCGKGGFSTLTSSSLNGGSSTGGGGGTGGTGELPPSGANITITGQAWYVRTNGGDATQCDGKTDADYSGVSTGAIQHCAFKNPHYLWGNDVYGETATWKIASGDTVILRGGPYRLGYKALNQPWGQCEGDQYGCTMPKIPAGTSTQHTKILGENFANCTTKTQLYGGFGLSYVVNLEGTQNVDVACLELTDHGTCTRYGTGDAIPCNTATSDYAGSGIVTNNQSANINMIDLNIHGFTSRGIIGAIGGLINVNHVRIGYNAAAGWDFDDGSGTASPAGSLVNADYLTVEWSGCNEEYPIVDQFPARTCYDQSSAGYGDGIGTPNTGLDFTCNHCNFNHNTQDGFDLLHTSGSQITVTNSLSEANMGQQWKMGPMATITFENNLTIHDCKRMLAAQAGAPAGYNAALSNYCRAANGAIVFSMRPGGVYNFDNNSLIGYADTDYQLGCSTSDCSTSQLNFRNNINIGYPSPISGQLPGLFYYNDAGVTDAVWHNRSNNIYYHGRSCPTGYPNETCVDPLVVNEPATYSSEAIFDSVDLHLTAASPAKDSGITIPTILTDYYRTARPQGPAYDIGAVELPQ